MRKMTWEEVQEHQKNIKQIRDRALRARARYVNGDITVKKLKLVNREVREEEATYIQTSGVLLYFGQLFKKTT